MPNTPELLREAADAVRALMAVAEWLELNDATTADEVIELLQSTNDNPNITPLPEKD